MHAEAGILKKTDGITARANGTAGGDRLIRAPKNTSALGIQPASTKDLAGEGLTDARQGQSYGVLPMHAVIVTCPQPVAS